MMAMILTTMTTAVCFVMGGLFLYDAAVELMSREWCGAVLSSLAGASCMLTAIWLVGVICG